MRRQAPSHVLQARWSFDDLHPLRAGSHFLRTQEEKTARRALAASAAQAAAAARQRQRCRARLRRWEHAQAEAAECRDWESASRSASRGSRQRGARQFSVRFPVHGRGELRALQQAKEQIECAEHLVSSASAKHEQAQPGWTPSRLHEHGLSPVGCEADSNPGSITKHGSRYNAEVRVEGRGAANDFVTETRVRGRSVSSGTVRSCFSCAASLRCLYLLCQ